MKFSPKMPHLNRGWLMLGGAIALGVIATLLSHKMLKDHMAAIDAEVKGAHKMVTVVVPKQDLRRGTPIQAGMFAKRKIPADFVHASYVDPGHFGQYVGQRLGAPLKAGEALLDVHLESTSTVFSSTLENGNRALTTEVDEVNSISGMLRPTDHIDLMATAHGSGANVAETTFSLMSNVDKCGKRIPARDGSTSIAALISTMISPLARLDIGSGRIEPSAILFRSSTRSVCAIGASLAK